MGGRSGGADEHAGEPTSVDQADADAFWEQAEAAASHRARLPDAARAALLTAEADVDAAFEGTG